MVEVDDGVQLEDQVRLWSDPVSWRYYDESLNLIEPGVPQAGDDVLIRPTWNMLYDMPDDPNYVLNSLTIESSRLSIDDVANRSLITRNIWNKGGQLYIGAEDNRITNSKITITLVGAQDDDVIDIDGIGDPGNKVLVNTGKVKWYGA